MSEYVICINNESNPASLIVGKVYRTLPDAEAQAHDLLRVIDEDTSEPDGYLYSASIFAPIELPETAKQAGKGRFLHEGWSVMTNRERILTLIQAEPGLTDAEIRERTGVQPHQQVNQICRKLAQSGLICRSTGPEGRLINIPRNVRSSNWQPEGRRHATETKAIAHPSLCPPVGKLHELPYLELSKTLFVLPCSGKKTKDRRHLRNDDTSILDNLPDNLANELRTKRVANAPLAKVDESTLLPAVERYIGYLYQAAGSVFTILLDSGADVLIISGGYGVALAREPIGLYDQKYCESMWPNDLIPRCLSAHAGIVRAESVVGLFSATTEYASTFSKTSWPRTVKQAFLISPERTPGAMVKAPRAQGETLKVIGRDHILRPNWTSSDGLRMQVTRIAGA